MDFPNICFGKKFSRFLCVLFSAVLIAVPLLLFLLPASDYSEEENRMLATPPTFSAEALLGGAYTDGLSAYLCDHLPLRGTLLKTKSLAEYAALKLENNHVIAAGNGYLVKRFEYTEEQIAAFEENINIIHDLTQALGKYQKPVTFLCAPRAIDVLTDLCSDGIKEPNARSPWTALKASDMGALTVTELLREKASAGEYVWYRTDHHWTTLGAYYTYTALGKSLEYTPLPLDAFEQETVSETFLGTSYSACLLPMTRADSVTAMRYEGDDDFVCTDRSTGIEARGFYRPQALSAKDQYEYFLGKNTAHLRIVKNSDAPRPTLLIIKDSYAQSLVPFLARHFDIELIDLRYFRTDATETLRNILNAPNYAGTLILCNADTLTGDAGLGHLDVENL